MEVYIKTANHLRWLVFVFFWNTLYAPKSKNTQVKMHNFISPHFLCTFKIIAHNSGSHNKYIHTHQHRTDGRTPMCSHWDQTERRDAWDHKEDMTRRLMLQETEHHRYVCESEHTRGLYRIRLAADPSSIHTL